MISHALQNQKVYNRSSVLYIKLKGGENMDKKLTAAVGITVVFLAVSVTASSLPATPLYTIRMEQQSSKMHFLPTAVSEFTYATTQGHTVSYAYPGGQHLLDNIPTTPICTGSGPTCWKTCLNTCPDTCYTCSTCLIETCPDTCAFTCGGSTCNPPC